VILVVICLLKAAETYMQAEGRFELFEKEASKKIFVPRKKKREAK
jgi:hypothetical protein